MRRPLTALVVLCVSGLWLAPAVGCGGTGQSSQSDASAAEDAPSAGDLSSGDLTPPPDVAPADGEGLMDAKPFDTTAAEVKDASPDAAQGGDVPSGDLTLTPDMVTPDSGGLADISNLDDSAAEVDDGALATADTPQDLLSDGAAINGDALSDAFDAEASDANGCDADTDGCDPLTFRVMSFNILVGGGALVSLDRTIEVIAEADVDVVTLQEQSGSAETIADALGMSWRVVNSSVAMLSHWPLVSVPGPGVAVDVGAGKAVYVYGVHLPAYPYQPYDIRDGLLTTPEQAVAAAQSARGAQISAALVDATASVQAGHGVFFMGDFNEPSHLDWTAATAAAGMHFGMAVPWPTSTAVEAAGMTDVYRAIHADPVTDPGDTWTPTPGANEVHDRIDLLYAAGQGVTTLGVQVYGEDAAYADVPLPPWPSDHRAVVGTFSLDLPALGPLPESVTTPGKTEEGCTCLETWSYSGMTHQGCSTTADYALPWCYVVESDCGTPSTTPGNPNWDVCTLP